MVQDYGNSETNDADDGCGTMEAIFFGNCSGTQDGPCIRADLENGMCVPAAGQWLPHPRSRT